MKHRQGRIEVICGSMFSGKSEELIRRIRRAMIARQKVMVFKPSIDDRYGIDSVTSHSGSKVEAIAVEKASDILSHINGDTTVVALDEAQFFDPDVIDVCRFLVESKEIRVLIAGLDMDFRGEPFGAMPYLMAIADDVDKLHAICVISGDEATFTQRLVNGEPAGYDDPIIQIGADEAYEPRSRRHHQVPGKPNKFEDGDHD